jgi:peptidoglycan/LPS O-acetylase OafA/YrhL
MTSKTYRSDIDGLRGVAIAGVVAFHYFPHVVRGGFVGVDIFFVISGYLIAGIILRQLREGAFGLINFYARRIRRIIPSLLIILAASSAFGWYVLFPGEFSRLMRNVLAGAMFFSNFQFWGESGYFDPSADTKPLLHLWSLAIEEQFYILLPAWVLFARRKRWPALPVIAGASLFSLVLCIVQSNHDAVAAFYSPFSRIWEILCGVILAYTAESRRSGQGGLALTNSEAWTRVRATADSVWFRNSICAVGLVCIFASCIWFSKATVFPGVFAAAPVVGAGLVVSAGSGAFINRFVLSCSPLVRLGLISYPLYMWHWPILIFARIVAGDLLMPTQRLELIAISIGLALATYLFLERPVRGEGGRRATLALIAGVLGVGILSSLAVAFNLQPRAKGAGLESILNAALDWGYPPPSFRMVLADGHRFWRQDSQVKETTIFIGDSNMEQYAPRVSELLLKSPSEYRSVIFATTGGCSPIPAIFLSTPGECQDRMIQAYRLARSPNVDTVVLGASWILHVDLAANSAYLESLEQLIRGIAAERRVFLVLNMPTGPELDPKNMFSGSRITTVVPKPTTSVRFDLRKFLSEYAPLRAELRERGTRSGAYVIDPLEFLCGPDSCPVFDKQGEPLYRDASHMRPFYVDSSAAFIDKSIEYRQPQNVTHAGDELRRDRATSATP